ncbi:MAG: hypothetical protein R3E10_07980 [Gemmatimonadota bacterium]
MRILVRGKSPNPRRARRERIRRIIAWLAVILALAAVTAFVVAARQRAGRFRGVLGWAESPDQAGTVHAIGRPIPGSVAGGPRIG